MLLLNLIRACFWLIVLLLTSVTVYLTANLVLALIAFIVAYALVMTGADVIEQKVLEKFNET